MILDSAPLRLVEPEDYAGDPNTLRYHARLAYTLMRDRPLVFAHRAHELIIDPAPVKSIHWLNGEHIDIPYRDTEVEITRAKARLRIRLADMDEERRYAIHRAAVAVSDHIYGGPYQRMFCTTQDVLRTYVHLGSAMSMESSTEDFTVSYGASDTTGSESFTISEHGHPQSVYDVRSHVMKKKSDRSVHIVYTCHAHTDTQQRHDQHAQSVMALRNNLQRYSWQHHQHNGISAPVGWQHMR